MIHMKKLSRTILALAVTAGLLSFAATAARADDWHDHEEHARDWHEKHHHHHGHAYGHDHDRPVIVEEPNVVYAPPVVVEQPREESPGITLTIPLNFN
jgi:hypothetical protein